MLKSHNSNKFKFIMYLFKKSINFKIKCLHRFLPGVSLFSLFQIMQVELGICFYLPFQNVPYDHRTYFDVFLAAQVLQTGRVLTLCLFLVAVIRLLSTISPISLHSASTADT